MVIHTYKTILCFEQDLWFSPDNMFLACFPANLSSSLSVHMYIYIYAHEWTWLLDPLLTPLLDNIIKMGCLFGNHFTLDFGSLLETGIWHSKPCHFWAVSLKLKQEKKWVRKPDIKFDVFLDDVHLTGSGFIFGGMSLTLKLMLYIFERWISHENSVRQLFGRCILPIILIEIRLWH